MVGAAVPHVTTTFCDPAADAEGAVQVIEEEDETITLVHVPVPIATEQPVPNPDPTMVTLAPP